MTRSTASSTLPCLLFSLLLILAFSASPVAAFGSGTVSEASGVFGRNFLHGDIENVIETLVKSAASAGIIGAIFSGGKHGGKKFSKTDVARIYFGNWLRDMSQAVDVSALKILPAARIVNVVAVLGFLEFGYASREFEVTPERLGNYLTVEHIDNPTGYPDDKGSDPRVVANYDKLRGPLDPRELEIDQGNGMKNYIATEGREFDTAARFIKDNLIRAIELGRSGKHNEHDEWESLRLLGTALHTLEDFAAHSNYIEVALNHLGYDRVFTHVGDRVRIRAPNGREVSPIVTGSFGGADFMHSMLGTAEDKLSQNSVQDMSARLGAGKGKDSSLLRSALKLLLSKDKGDGNENNEQEADNKVNRLEELQKKAQEMNPLDISNEEVHDFIMETLRIHDDIARTISGVIDRIPGLDDALDSATNNLTVFVCATLEPVMAPIIDTVIKGLFEASAAVVDNHDQTIVFNDENASDPTHSMLAKDHFGNILNAPAGQIAQIIVRHTVQAVVEAWDDEGINPREVADRVCTALHHPVYVADRPTPVQADMLKHVDVWINSHGNEKDEVLRRLERDAILNHRNNTDGISGGNTIAAADAQAKKYSAANEGIAGLVKPGGLLSNAPGADVVAGVLNTLNLDDKKPQQTLQAQQQSNYQQQQQQHQQSRPQQHQQQEYGRQQNEGRYEHNNNNNRFDDDRRQEYNNNSGSNRFDDDRRQESYGRQEYNNNNNRFDEDRRQESYGGRQEYNNNNSYDGGNRFDDNDRRQESYGRRNDEDRFNSGGGGRTEYGGGERRDEDRFGGGRNEYGGRQEENRFGDSDRRFNNNNNDYDDNNNGRRFNNNDENEFGSGNRYERNEYSSGGRGGGYERRDEDDYGRRY